MKKITLILSLVLILALTSVTAFAQTTNEIIVSIDSVKVNFDENTGSPFVDENYRTLVPFRKSLETYGASVEWDNETRIAIAVKGDIRVEVPIDKNYITVNGQEKATDTAAKIVNGRTYLPIRAVIEAFGSSVEWDQSLNTVVITTVPVDAKAILTKANSLSSDWKNYDGDIKVNMSMPIKDDAGSVQTVNMDMKMYMTFFTDPSLKAKINSSFIMNLMGQDVSRPVMDMYMVADKKSFTTYMGTAGQDGKLTWVKSTVEDEIFASLFANNKEAIKENQELSEKYMKDVKYFGKYTDASGRTLLKLQYTISGEIYKEVFGKYAEIMPASENEQDAMVLEMMKDLANGSFGDITAVIYVNESTGEIVKYEMDLSDIMSSMMSGMTEMLGTIPANEMEMLKQMKVSMSMEYLNINKAADFKIPEEALNAPEVTEAAEVTQ
ncbi:MAG TPA: hypothetical protein DC038_02110 [Clostridiales bacterium]|nr:hypothetical protein [Clostridiales bacterium]